MKKYILDFVCQLEGQKTAIKSLHWHANSLSQHQLCDDIASAIADYQDKVSEVEQSISGKLPLNNLKGTPYKVTTLKKFVQDVISGTNSFYKKLKNEGDNYIGMRSDTEAFLSDMQRQLYLVDFTVKEALKERLRNKINENRVTISNGEDKYSLTENELRELVDEAIKNVAKKNVNEASQVLVQSARHEMQLYYQSLTEFENKTRHVANLMAESGYDMSSKLLNNILMPIYEAIEYINEKYIKGHNV